MSEKVFDLAEVKADLYRILNAPGVTRAEVRYVLKEIRAGHIDGYLYINSEDYPKPCGCIIGTIALKRGMWDEWGVLSGTMGFQVDAENPIEDYLYLTRYGATPETSVQLANVESWIVEWLGAK